MNAIIIYYTGSVASDYTIERLVNVLRHTDSNCAVTITSLDEEHLKKMLLDQKQWPERKQEIKTSDLDMAFTLIGTMFKVEIRQFESDNTPFVAKLVTILLSLKKSVGITKETRALLKALIEINKPVMVYDQDIANKYGITSNVISCIKEITESFTPLILEKLK